MEEHPERVPRWAPALEPALPLAISSLFMLASSFSTCQAAIASQVSLRGDKPETAPRELASSARPSMALPLSGSNVFALPASRMREGEAVFSSDSHGVIEDANGTFLTPTRIRAGQLDAWLLDVPGAIMGLKGHSRHYGWGWAEGPRRPADCIVIETVPGKPRTYLYDGQPVEMTVQPYVIKVAGADSVQGELEYTSHNGVMSPVVHRSGSKVWAVSSSYLGRAGFAHVQFRDMLLATNEVEMDRALSAREIYPANLVYSGSDGSINYIRPGRIPIRPDGFDGSKAVDGNTSAGAWLGVRGLAELLRLKNPAQGYLSNSNVSPDMMFGEPVLKAESYPADFAFQPGLTGTRQLRSIQMLQGDRVFSFEDAIAVVGDVLVVNTDQWGPVIRQVMSDARARLRFRAPAVHRYPRRVRRALRSRVAWRAVPCPAPDQASCRRSCRRDGDRIRDQHRKAALHGGASRTSSAWSIRAMRRSRGPARRGAELRRRVPDRAGRRERALARIDAGHPCRRSRDGLPVVLGRHLHTAGQHGPALVVGWHAPRIPGSARAQGPIGQPGTVRRQ